MLAQSEDISDSRKRKILGASEETGFCSEPGGRPGGMPLAAIVGAAQEPLQV